MTDENPFSRCETKNSVKLRIILRGVSMAIVKVRLLATTRISTELSRNRNGSKSLNIRWDGLELGLG